MKKLLIIILSLLLCNVIHAQKITELQALEKAKAFMTGKTFSNKERSLRRAIAKDVNDAFYIFNADDNNGFVIVSGDERTEDILGFSDTGHIDLDNMPENMRAWLEEYKKEIESTDIGYIYKRASSNHPNIEPLIQTKWGQDAPFNMLCPLVNGIQCPTGCVITALAQIMYYHKWPKDAVEELSAYGSNPEVSAFPSTTFAWDKMRTSYKNYSTEEAHAVAELMRYCGQALHARYGITGTAAGLTSQVLINTLHYSKSYKGISRALHPREEWEDLIYQELAERRPVFLSGNGHAYVCDGYKNGYFSINWGWNGDGDGFFLLHENNYSFGQYAYIGIQPSYEGETTGFHETGPQRKVECFVSGMGWKNTINRESINDDFEIELLPRIAKKVGSMDSYQGEIAFAVYRGKELCQIISGERKEYTGPVYNNMVERQRWIFHFGANYPNGQYTLGMVARKNKEYEWKNAHCSMIATINQTEMKLDQASSEVQIDPQFNIYDCIVNSVQYDNMPIYNQSCKVKINFTHLGQTYTVPFYLWAENVLIEKKCAYVNPGETADVEISFVCNSVGKTNYSISTSVYYDNIYNYTIEIPFSKDGIYFLTEKESNTMKVIGANQNTTKVTIPETISFEGTVYHTTSISASAFERCKDVTYLLIPSSVISIGDGAFGGCTGLTTIVSEITEPYIINESVFSSETYANATLMVPKGKKAAYKATKGWNKFSNIIESGGGDVSDEIISFDDNIVKALCVVNWDTDGDGELSKDEAASVTDLGTVFKEKPEIISFNELQHFTGLVSICNEAFKDCNSLISITIPNSVTSIGYRAFEGCGNLKSITISNSVTSIGDRVFWGCSNLKSITIPNSITAISDFTFYGCSSLTSVTIPNSVTSIGEFAFTHCSSLNSITIPNSVTSIGKLAFLGCSGLTTITMPNSVTSIENRTFEGCSGLTSITIPKNVTSIGLSAFYSCSGLTSIVVESGNLYYDSRNDCNAIIETASNTLIRGCNNTIIPNTVTSIDQNAFNGCNNLTTVTIPNSVVLINNDAFNGCSGLTSVTIPNSVTLIGGGAFRDCNKLTSIIIPNSVTTISGGTFEGCSGLMSVVIPNSVTSIGENAFYECSALTSVTLPNSVTSIDNYAFLKCSSLKTIVSEIEEPFDIIDVFETSNDEIVLIVPKGKKAAYQATEGWNKFMKIVEDRNDGIISIVDDAVEVLCIANWDTNKDGELSIEEAAAVTDLGTLFKDNLKIKSFDELQYFTGLTSISDDAFNGCWNLTSVTIPHSVTSIGNYAFHNCHLKTIAFPNALESIGNYAFGNCLDFTSVYFPNSVKSIGINAFQNCFNLTSITIPQSVTSIGEEAFGSCYGLTSIMVESGNLIYDSRNNCNAIIETSSNTLIVGCKSTIIPNSVTIIGKRAFYGCSNLTSVTIPNSVTEIDRWAFWGCKGLTSITIPNSVTTINYGTFMYCSALKSVTIPNNVTTIGGSAFKECTNLKVIFNFKTEPVWIDNSTFDGVDKEKCILYVPDESVEKYQEAEVWKEFKQILPLSSLDNNIIQGDVNGDSEVNVADIVEIVNFILGKPSAKFLETAADLNGDGEINVSDIVKLVSIIMSTNNVRKRSSMIESPDHDKLLLAESEDYALSLHLNNESGYVASQFDIRLSGGSSLESITLNSSRCNGHLMTYSEIGENFYRVVIYSPENRPFTGNSGELLKIMTEGTGDVEISNILFITSNQSEKTFSTLHYAATMIQTLETSEPMDVYSLDGRQIRKQVETTDGLKKGIYIINRQKIIIN